MEGDIKFYEDIIKEISEETGIRYKEIKEIIDLDIKFIKKQAEDPNVVSIYVGKNIGTLHCNFWQQIAEINSKKNSPVKQHHELIDNILKPRKKIMEDFIHSFPSDVKYKLKYTKKPYIFYLKMQIKKLFNITIGAVANPNKIWSKVADFQNEANKDE